MSNTSSVLTKYFVGMNNESIFTITANSQPALVIDPTGKVTFPQNVNNVNETIKAAFDKFLSENNFLQFFTNTTNASPYHLGIDNKSNFVISANSLPALVIDPSGKVTFPQTTNVANTAQKVFFDAYLSSIVATAGSDGLGTPIIPDIIVSNIGGNYNNNNGEFTAPVSGVYHFNARLVFRTRGSLSTDSFIYTRLQAGSQQYQQFCEPVSSNKLISCSISQSILMNANEIAKVFGDFVRPGYPGFAWGEIKGDPKISHSSFSGYLLN